MYKIRKMKFKSIIKNGEETSSVEFEGNGTVRIDDSTLAYYLDYGKEHYEFIYDQKILTLKQNKSLLHLELGKSIANSYHTAYGDLMIDASLMRCEFDEKGMKIMYDLYQMGEKISRIYMVIILA